MFHLGRPELLEFGILAERIHHLRQMRLLVHQEGRERDVHKWEEDALGNAGPSKKF